MKPSREGEGDWPWEDWMDWAELRPEPRKLTYYSLEPEPKSSCVRYIELNFDSLVAANVVYPNVDRSIFR